MKNYVCTSGKTVELFTKLFKNNMVVVALKYSMSMKVFCFVQKMFSKRTLLKVVKLNSEGRFFISKMTFSFNPFHATGILYGMILSEAFKDVEKIWTQFSYQWQCFMEVWRKMSQQESQCCSTLFWKFGFKEFSKEQSPNFASNIKQIYCTKHEVFH